VETLVANFSSGVERIAERETWEMGQPIREGGEVSELVKGLVLALNQQARGRPHSSVLAGLGINAALILTLVFNAGVMWSRLNSLEDKVKLMPQSTESITVQITDMKLELDRLSRAVEKMTEQQRQKER